MSINEMSAKVRELKELKAMAEELAQEITAIEDSIKAELNSQNKEEMIVGAFKVRWTTVSSERFDTTAFKKALPELAKQFTKTNTTRRFSIV